MSNKIIGPTFSKWDLPVMIGSALLLYGVFILLAELGLL